MQKRVRYTWCVVVFCFIPSTLGAPILPTAVVVPRTFCTGCIAWIRCSDWQLNCEPESLGAVPPHTVYTESEGSGLCQWGDPVRGDLLYVPSAYVNVRIVSASIFTCRYRVKLFTSCVSPFRWWTHTLILHPLD